MRIVSQRKIWSFFKVSGCIATTELSSSIASSTTSWFGDFFLDFLKSQPPPNKTIKHWIREIRGGKKVSNELSGEELTRCAIFLGSKLLETERKRERERKGKGRYVNCLWFANAIHGKQECANRGTEEGMVGPIIV